MNAVVNRLASASRSGKKIMSISCDMILVAVSLWLAYLFRLDGVVHSYTEIWVFFVILPPITCFLYHFLGIYRWIVRTSNSVLFTQIVKGTAISSLILALLMFLTQPENIYTRSVVVVYAIIVTGLTLGWRMMWRQVVSAATGPTDTGQPIAIYGAGVSGRTLQDFLKLRQEKRVALFLDDDAKFTSATTGGVPIYQPAKEDLKSLFFEYGVNEVILALPDISSDEFRRIQKQFNGLDVKINTVPSLTELSAGFATLSDVRQISFADILGRTEVPPNPVLLRKCVTGKSVMVTGGGGSIGSEICRQILRLEPKSLIVLDSSELNVYEITEELNNALDDLETSTKPLVFATLGSIGDKKKVSALLDEYAVDTVYHAAAFKHVPVLETDPEQAIVNNVFGTLTLLDAAIAKRVETFILISSDKAVRPTNVMGATKRVAEMILQAKAETLNGTCIAMVRFGNVLGSSGSVVPKFKRQIQEGGPVTVTHKNITRFFMTIPEAAQLVLQAGSIARGGEVFVLDMGDPVKICDLAKSMIELSGEVVGDEPGQIPIEYVGLRPGEKMYEELFISNQSKQTQVSKIFVDRDDFLSWDLMRAELDALESMLGREHTRAEIRSALLKLIDIGEKKQYTSGRPETPVGTVVSDLSV